MIDTVHKMPTNFCILSDLAVSELVEMEVRIVFKGNDEFTSHKFPYFSIAFTSAIVYIVTSNELNR